MANQTIPIALTAGPVPPGFEAATIDQLMQAVATYISGAIRADVSFYLEVIVDPTNFVTNLIFNSTTRVWKAWNVATGTYVPLTQYQVGDVKNSFSGADQLEVGWVVLDGRAFTAIAGISAAQLAVLQTLFGGTTLPVVTPTNTQNLPGAAAFSGIAGVTVLPADGVIGALPFDPTTYTPAESEALRDDTEILRDSTADVEAHVAAVQTQCSNLLTALRGSTTPPLYAMIFVGFA